MRKFIVLEKVPNTKRYQIILYTVITIGRAKQECRPSSHMVARSSFSVAAAIRERGEREVDATASALRQPKGRAPTGRREDHLCSGVRQLATTTTAFLLPIQNGRGERGQCHRCTATAEGTTGRPNSTWTASALASDSPRDDDADLEREGSERLTPPPACRDD
uniref:Uncharacterized protein n=1 Tax=Oryza brachyantha TaxID=4533 RepID=J3M0R7_ORYBR